MFTPIPVKFTSVISRNLKWGEKGGGIDKCFGGVGGVNICKAQIYIKKH